MREKKKCVCCDGYFFSSRQFICYATYRSRCNEQIFAWVFKMRRKKNSTEKLFTWKECVIHGRKEKKSSIWLSVNHIRLIYCFLKQLFSWFMASGKINNFGFCDPKNHSISQSLSDKESILCFRFFHLFSVHESFSSHLKCWSPFRVGLFHCIYCAALKPSSFHTPPTTLWRIFEW